jgi:hypothetical protein
MLPATMRRRRVVQRSRRISVRELERLMRTGLPERASRAHRLLFELAPHTARRRASRR